MTRWRNKTLIPMTLTPSIGAKKSKIKLTRTKGKQIKIKNDVTCNMKPRCFIEITIIRIPTCPRISQNNNNSKKIKCGTFQEFQGNLISCLLCTVRPNKKIACLASIHPNFSWLGGQFFFVFLSNEAYLVFIIQWGTSLHLHLSDYETTIPLFTMKPTTRRKKNVWKVWYSHAYNLISTM